MSEQQRTAEEFDQRLEANDGPGATFAFSIPRDPGCTTDAAPV